MTQELSERFTARARKIYELANREAQRLNHEYIGTEHLLLGLVLEGTGVAANALVNLNLDLHRVRQEVEKVVQSGSPICSMGNLPQTPAAKRVIEWSMQEAQNLNHNYVGTEHILLGLLRQRECVAAQVLMNLGLRLEQARAEIRRLLQLPQQESGQEYGLQHPGPSWIVPSLVAALIAAAAIIVILVSILLSR